MRYRYGASYCASKGNQAAMANYTLHLLYVELHIVGFLFLIDGLLAMPELRVVTSRLARLQSIIDQEVVARAVRRERSAGAVGDAITLDRQQ